MIRYIKINNTFNIGRASYFDIKSIYGLSILKRCSEELKVAINYMDVDDVSVEAECDKVSGNTHCKMKSRACLGLFVTRLYP